LPPITEESDIEGLTLLGKEATPSKKLEVFPNHHRERDYTVTLQSDEFTCLCPKTGQPDFANITITYIPDQAILESKSLKLYLWSFRNEGAFHEHVTNRILDDLVAALEPRWCKVSAKFNLRGGIAITVDAEYKKAAIPTALPSPPREQERARRNDREERQTAGRGNYHSPSPRWTGVNRERSRPERETSRYAKEKHVPPPAERQVDGEIKRSERRTTKSLGVTRTWRKRT
jgi:7-cyano-7-deazaguanine reductase